MESVLVPLRPQSLAEWADTDMAWWQQLAAARDAWTQGRQGGNTARKAIAQATAHLRRK